MFKIIFYVKNNNMKKYIYFIIIFMIISLNNLSGYPVLLKKQLLFYLLSFLIIIFVNRKFIFKYIKYFYWFINILLLYLLIFGSSVNGIKAWIDLGFITFQPSEFMKIILIIYLNLIAIKDKYLLKCIVITMIPAFLTFLEPDTGNVIFYLIILLSVIFNKERNSKKLLIITSIFILMFLLIIFSFINNKQLFINIFGSNIIYRIERVTDFKNTYQLNMALMGIGISHYFGKSSFVDVPEITTDFSFTNIIMMNGLIGVLIYLITNVVFNFKLINDLKYKNNLIRCVGISFITMKLVQEFIHVFMNIGYLPITGITLPFISYGGSSILTYFLLISIFNYNMDNYSMVDSYSKELD